MGLFRPLQFLMIVAIATVFGTSSLLAGVFDLYAGSWKGKGSALMKNGNREAISCKVKSITELQGTRIYQIVKCKSRFGSQQFVS